MTKPEADFTEFDWENFQNLQDVKTKYEQEINDLTEKRALVKQAFKIAKHWDINVKKPPPELKGMVIKLTPDLREYILKNGLPRFKKGGIVDLALHGAQHA
jgi:hypothetical protein